MRILSLTLLTLTLAACSGRDVRPECELCDQRDEVCRQECSSDYDACIAECESDTSSNVEACEAECEGDRDTCPDQCDVELVQCNETEC